MKSHFQPFSMERWQSLYENQVQFNLSESGVHPLSVREFLDLSGASDFNETLLGYGLSIGSDLLRAHIAQLCSDRTTDSIVVTHGSA